MKSLLYKELKSLCFSPAYFVILAVFIALLHFLYLKGFLIDGIMNFRGYFGLSLWFLIIFIPAIAMRIMSEEYKSGTLELLLTKPLKIQQIVGGKYLSLLVYFCIYIVSVFLLYATLSLLGSFPAGIFIAQCVGYFLLIATIFALSLLASSITKNQIFAFLIGVCLNFILTLIGTPIVAVSLPDIIVPLVRSMAYMPHLESFSQGMISLYDIIYFTSLIVGSLFFSAYSITSFQKRGTFALKNIWVKPLSIFLCICVCNYLLTLLPPMAIDTTRTRVNTLSEDTKELLKEIPESVTVTLYASSALPPELDLLKVQFADKMGKFMKYSTQITYEEKDVSGDTVEKELSEKGIPSIQIQTIKDDQFATQKGYLGVVMQKGDKFESIPYIGNEKNLEYSLLSKMIKLTRKNLPKVTLVTSSDVSAEVIDKMKKLLAETTQISHTAVTNETKVIEKKEGEIYLVIEGTTPFSKEISVQIAGMQESHTLLYFFQPYEINTEALTATKKVTETADILMKKLGITLLEGLAGDAAHANSVNISQSGFTFPVLYPLYPKIAFKIRPDAETSQVHMPFPGALDGAGETLLATSEYGFLRTDLSILRPESLGKVSKSDLKSLTVGKIFKNNNTTVVIPNTLLFTLVPDQLLAQNVGFLTNIIDQIAGDPRLIDIRGKTITYNPATQDEFKIKMIKLFNIYLFPLVIFGTGIIIAAVRQRRRG